MPSLARAPPVGPASLAQFGAAAPGPVVGPPASARAFGMPRAPNAHVLIHDQNAHVLIHDQTSLEVVLPGGPIQGSQVVPQAWLRQSTTPVVNIEDPFRYGWHWFLLSA